MSKHSQLAQLLTAFETAVRNHAAATQSGALTSSAASLYEIADKAEKRIFSFFDTMQTELTDQVRRTETLREQRDAIARAATRPPAPNVPFDEAAAAAGKPVQVLYDGVWRDVKYLGKGECGHVVECGSWADCGLSYWGVENMRMKPKATRQLQMFANVYRSDVEWGTLKTEQTPAHPIQFADQIASNIPVTITVAD